MSFSSTTDEEEIRATIASLVEISGGYTRRRSVTLQPARKRPSIQHQRQQQQQRPSTIQPKRASNRIRPRLRVRPNHTKPSKSTIHHRRPQKQPPLPTTPPPQPPTTPPPTFRRLPSTLPNPLPPTPERPRFRLLCYTQELPHTTKLPKNDFVNMTSGGRISINSTKTQSPTNNFCSMGVSGVIRLNVTPTKNVRCEFKLK